MIHKLHGLDGGKRENPSSGPRFDEFLGAGLNSRDASDEAQAAFFGYLAGCDGGDAWTGDGDEE
jgi:hypothetical protein